MQREREFVKNTFVLSVGRLLPKITALITLPILTACLTKAEYGTYDLITTLIMLVIPIATLQIQSAAFRFLIDYRHDRIGAEEIISNIFAVTIPISLAVSCVIPLFFGQLTLFSRLLIGVYFFIDTLYVTASQIARGLGYNKYYSIGSSIISFVNMLGIILAVYISGQGILGVMLSLAAAQIAGFVFISAKSRLFSYISFQRASGKRIKELLAYSWPMIPNNLSSWVLKLSDRLVITAFIGVQANAVYAVANKIPNLLALAQQIVVMAWQENASIAVKDKDAGEYYSKMLRSMFDLMFGFTALLIAGTPLIFRILIRGDYGEAYYQMPVLILAMFFFAMSSFFGGIYVAHKKTINVGVTTMVAAGINLAIDLGFINYIGIWAASLSTLIAYVVLYYYRMINSKNFQPIKVNWGRQSVQIAVMCGMLGMCFMQTRILNIANAVLGVMLFALFNRRIIRKAVNKLKKR